MASPAIPGPSVLNASQVEAASRALVALVFLVALWLDPAEPVRNDLIGGAVLMAFLAWSAVLILIAWRSWWWDHRLAWPAHAIDTAAFMAAVYYTEAPSVDFASPFMAFAVLLLIKARARWNWRTTVATALALIALYVVMGFAIAQAGFALDAYRFGRRAAYMLLLVIVLGWMGIERRVRLALPFPPLPPVPPPPPAGAATSTEPSLAQLMAVACDFARAATGARHAAIAWSTEEEPWTELVVSESGAALRIERLGPDLLEPLAPDHHRPIGAMLFDAPRRRALALQPDALRIALHPSRAPSLAAHLGVKHGIIAPIESDAGAGQLLVWDLTDPSFDRLALATQAADEIGRAFEREERARFAQRIAVAGAVSGVREAVARDLHDSAAQFLAGSMFRLEALRRRITGDDGVAAEIIEIKDAMRTEQVELRALIGQLRGGEALGAAAPDRRIDLHAELATLVGELGAHWHVDARLELGTRPVLVPVTLAHEVRQLVREAIANAARHGRSDRVTLGLAESERRLSLTVIDNGQGFPEVAGGAPVLPRSIAGRVAALGGILAVEPADPAGSPPGARLTICLDLQPAPTAPAMQALAAGIPA